MRFLLVFGTLFLAIERAVAELAEVQYRQADNQAAFSEAASALIDGYIPSSAFSVLSVSVSSAAAAASISGDASDLIHSALEDSTLPGWFSSAIPSAYVTELVALASAVASLRPTAVVSGATPTVSEILVTATRTDSAGHVLTTTFTSAIPASLFSTATGVSPASTATTSSIGHMSTTTSSTNAAPSNRLVGVFMLAGFLANL